MDAPNLDGGTRRFPRAGGPQLTDRDVEIVRWVTRHGVVTPELVARRFFWRPGQRTFGLRATHRRLRVLSRLRLILDRREEGTPHNVIRATRAGARLAAVGIGPAPFVLSQHRHAVAVVFLAEYLRHEYPGAELITERELWAQRYRDNRSGAHMKGLGRVPDALLRITGPDGSTRRVAIELDLSRKDRRELERIVLAYASEKVDVVWWYVRRSQVERVLEVVRLLNAEFRMEVRPWLG